MNAPSVDIKDLIVSEGLGQFAKNIFIGKEPSEPKNCVTIYDTGGGEQDPKFAIDEVTFQIRARNIQYVEGYTRLKEIKKLIEGKESFLINGSKYVGIWAQSNIAFITYDESNCAIWTINFRITREPQDGELGNRKKL